MKLSKWTRPWKLKKIGIGISLDSERLITVEEIAQGNSRRHAAERELFDLVESDPELRGIMGRLGATRKDLEHAYEMLGAVGAGRTTRA